MVDQLPARWHPYTALLGSRIRAQLQYRTSFTLDLLSSVALGLVEFAELYVVFHNVPVLGGLDWTAALLVFGLADSGFALADLVAGHLDEIPVYIRTGTLDVVMLRPLPVLLQMVLSDITLRRIGRSLVSIAALVWALARLDLNWTVGRITLLLATPVTSAIIFGSLFLAAGAVQFFIVDGAEFTNGFTYGGAYAAQFSAAVYPLPLRVFYTFVVPAAFTGYLPALAILDRPGPLGLPAWLGWCTVPAAAIAGGTALLLWRTGVRHYRGAGG